MDDSLRVPRPITPTKRPLVEDQVCASSSNSPSRTPEQRGMPIQQAPTSPQSVGSSHSSKPTLLPNGLSRQLSPALSTGSSISTLSATPQPPFGLDGQSSSTENNHEDNSAPRSTGSSNHQPPAKRVKLTTAEKEQRRVEKELKERTKAEQKAKRDEEKLAKDEERQRKNEVKEQKKREKDLEKQRLEEERERKERAQKRINSFFIKPSVPIPGSVTVQKDLSDACEVSILSSPAPGTVPSKSDYHQTFLPFALPSHTTWGSTSQYSWDDGALQHIQMTVERSFGVVGSDSSSDPQLDQVLDLHSRGRSLRGVMNERVKDIIKRYANSTSNSIDLTDRKLVDPLETLQKVPMRYIHFDEDVRPPYIGTYTQIDHAQLRRASRNPFVKARQDTDYEYDSEAEWDEAELGEELGSECNSESESNDGADEMDDFLDDEDAEGLTSKKRILCGDIEPLCSGLCWEDAGGISSDLNGQNLVSYWNKLSLTQDCLRLPIDPFSSHYWQDETNNSHATKQTENSLQTPRPPLQARPNIFINGIAQMASQGVPPDSKPAQPPAQPARLLMGSDLEHFKQAVEGSVHTKVGLLALLKKQFPQFSNKLLGDTLSFCAERQGRNEAEKRWKIKDA